MSSPDPAFVDPDNATQHDAAQEITVLQQRLNTALRELEAFRHRARERAIEGFRNGDWDLDQLNESLRNLGLEPFEPTFVHRATAYVQFTVQVNDADYDRASEALEFIHCEQARQQFQMAISAVLRQHTQGPALTVRDLSAHTGGHPCQVMAG